MVDTELTMAKRIARAASVFERQRTGLSPKSVTVVHGDGTLVITLHGALSLAETELARTPEGATQVQEFHRQLFTYACQTLREQIEAIPGVAVREVASEIEPKSGAVVAVFATGTAVQVYLLAHPISEEAWNGPGPSAAGAPPSVGPASAREQSP